MSKIAALTPQLLTALALAGASAYVDARGRADTRRKQEDAAARYLDYQNRQKDRFLEMEEAERAAAREALDQNLEANTQANREAIIDAETDRLTQAFTQNLPTEVTYADLPGAQQPGRSEVFDEAMAGGIAKATAAARKRLAALARSTAYGGGSQFALGQELAESGRDAASEIGLIGDRRRSNVRSLRNYQAIPMEQFEYKQSLAVPILQAAALAVGGLSPEQFGKLRSPFWNYAPSTSPVPVLRPTPPVAPIATGSSGVSFPSGAFG